MKKLNRTEKNSHKKIQSSFTCLKEISKNNDEIRRG